LQYWRQKSIRDDTFNRYKLVNYLVNTVIIIE